jgi:hypothetical protein
VVPPPAAPDTNRRTLAVVAIAVVSICVVLVILGLLLTFVSGR